MKNIIAALFILLGLGLNAQVMFDEDGFTLSIMSVNKKHLKHLADNHITDIKTYAYSHKHPDGIVNYECRYDSHGNMLGNINYNKHGHIQSEFIYQYNDSNRMTSWVRLSKKGKPRWGASWIYDKLGNNIKAIGWSRDTGNVTYSFMITYNSKNNPTETKIYYYKKLNSTSTYEYYDDGSKKKTTTYNRRGKVIGVWSYDCDPIGKLQESKMKDTSKVCVHYETDKNGNPVKVKEEYTEGGWLFKYRLRKISKYDKDNNFIELIKMKMNGKETWHSSADIDTHGNKTEWQQYIPNSTIIKKRWVYTYNNLGDIIEATVYSKPSDKGSVLKYVYN